MTTRWTVTVDCHKPSLVASFWATALGYVEPPPPAGFADWPAWFVHHGVPEQEWDDGAYLADPDGVLPTISFLKVPEGKVVKNRLHLDLQVGGGRDATPPEVRWSRVQAEGDRLAAAGGRILAVIDGADGRPDHLMMADPEGNEFDVL